MLKKGYREFDHSGTLTEVLILKRHLFILTGIFLFIGPPLLTLTLV